MPALLTLLLIAPISSPAESTHPLVAGAMQGYSSTHGINVWTLRVGERSDNESLVQIVGVDHTWDKLIQKMTVEKTFKDIRYVVKRDGKPFVALIVNRGFGELHLPGEPTPLPIIHNGSLVMEGDAQQFLSDYLEQVAAAPM